LKFEFERYLAVYRGNRGCYRYRWRAVKTYRSVKKTLMKAAQRLNSADRANFDLASWLVCVFVKRWQIGGDLAADMARRALNICVGGNLVPRTAASAVVQAEPQNVSNREWEGAARVGEERTTPVSNSTSEVRTMDRVETVSQRSTTGSNGGGLVGNAPAIGMVEDRPVRHGRMGKMLVVARAQRTPLSSLFKHDGSLLPEMLPYAAVCRPALRQSCL
jgi:hypothetical protein